MGSDSIWDAIGFGLANKANNLADSIDVVYRLKTTTYHKSGHPFTNTDCNSLTRISFTSETCANNFGIKVKYL